MDCIIVPENALKDKEAFKQWFSSVYREMFEAPVVTNTLGKNGFPNNEEEALKLVETIMEVVNLALFGNPTVPNYKNKKKKYPTRVSDVLAVTAFILREQYNVLLINIGKFINVNHATVIYYFKKVDAMFFTSKKFAATYARILLSLNKSGIIPTIRLEREELRTILAKYSAEPIVLGM